MQLMQIFQVEFKLIRVEKCIGDNWIDDTMSINVNETKEESTLLCLETQNMCNRVAPKNKESDASY